MNIPKGKSLILFDGVCNLCDKWVHRIIKYDMDQVFVFASLHSEMGRSICKKLSIAENGTIVLINEYNYSLKSKAAFEILKKLKGPWRILLIFDLLPIAMTDFGYDLIAKNRYLVYGRKDKCLVPTKELKDKFLDL